jgi:ubiquinone/menaquinone biosynthesis C-methylase UbiE
MKGILDLEYAHQREKRADLKYRLRRRTDEILKAIAKFSFHPQKILDLGTAEGKMLEEIKLKYPSSLCVGTDYSLPLLNYGAKRFSDINFICADVQNLKFLRDEIFDVIIAAAVIEHLTFPLEMLRESFRLLKKGGILIITSPHPFWEKIANVFGLIKGDHQSVMSPKEILILCKNVELSILDYKGFMISPVGIMGELKIEQALAKLGLNKFLPNQLMVARK